MEIKRLTLCLAIACCSFGAIHQITAKPRYPQKQEVYLEKKDKGSTTRSIVWPIIAAISENGDTISLQIPENCDYAYITISGSMYLSDMVSVNEGLATLDISGLDTGLYYIDVELDNGSTYSGNIELL